MFEKEVQFIADYSLNKVRKLGLSFTLNQLLNIQMHPAILQYISSEFDFLIYQDRKNLLQKSSFDYSGPEIAKYLKLISQEVKKNKIVSYDEIKKLVNQAVAFNASFVIRPNWTLTKLVFTENKKKSVEEFRMLINYCFYYDFVKKILLTYFDKKNIISINTAEFENILGKIDNQLSSEDLNSYLDHALYSISDFYNIGGINSEIIPLRTIEIFLKEKNLMDHLIKLKREFSSESKQRVSVEELKNHLISKDALKPGHELSPVHPDEVSSVLEKENFDEEIVPPETNSELNEKPIEENNHEENENRFEPESHDLTGEIKDLGDAADFNLNLSDTLNLTEIDKVSEENPAEPDMKDSAEEKDKTIIMQKNEAGTFVPEAEPESSVPKKINGKKIKKDIFSFLSDKEIEKIVEAVFNEDRDDFTNTMERISECNSYEDAADIIKSLFRTYKVNPYSKEAILLTDSVSNYFGQP
ncbi:MAG: hypothetical protein ACM34N_14845 [Ignavibacteria bacterium]